MLAYPTGSVVFARLGKLARMHGEVDSQLLMSSRLVGIASRLPSDEFVGWQMRVPRVGLAELTAFGSAAVPARDLDWSLEEMGWSERLAMGGEHTPPYGLLFDVDYPDPPARDVPGVGFLSEPQGKTDQLSAYDTFVWPLRKPTCFPELVRAMRDEGCVLRWVAGPATKCERQACAERVRGEWRTSRMLPEEYLGIPLKARLMVLAPERPSYRLVMALEAMVPGAELRYLGDVSQPDVLAKWDAPLPQADVLPSVAACISCVDPVVGDAVVVGLACAEREADPRPAEHDRPRGKHLVTLGDALWSNGLRYDVQLGARDLTRHWQVVGQTGTGKSTLLTNVALDAVRKGYGVTLLDPHGTTVDAILERIPEREQRRIRVVRIGDTNRPVPMSMWPSPRVDDCERTISDLSELFADLFDPRHEGIVGPRWQHIFATFARANIALFGTYASFDTITLSCLSEESRLALAKAIYESHRDLALTIKNEYGVNRSNDLQEVLAWFVSKFEQLTNQRQVRETLGAGINALDWGSSIDTDAVTLVDLASPTIGTPTARMVGTIVLSQLWEAVLRRQRRDLTHLVMVDEANLFQTNPLPRMLAEGRKFGLGMVLAHQNVGQLSSEVRDALVANSGHFSSLRASVRECDAAAIRLGGGKRLADDLVRLPDFDAVTTLNVGGRQTEAFTLHVERREADEDGEGRRKRIEDESWQAYGWLHPYRALSRADIRLVLDQPHLMATMRRHASPNQGGPTVGSMSQARGDGPASGGEVPGAHDDDADGSLLEDRS